MIVMSHRGYWKSPSEKNTEIAFERSFKLGFGTETDLRDLDGSLVVSHDPPRTGAMPAERLFELHRQIGPTLPLALNIKADGLQKLLLPIIAQFAVRFWFAFDMSAPDTLAWSKENAPFYARQSELEPTPILYDKSAGIWLDGFRGEWWDESTISSHLDAGKKVCVVSPELHRREFNSAWQRLRCFSFAKSDSLMICTDVPEAAKEFFDA